MQETQRLAVATVNAVADGRNLETALAAAFSRHSQLTAQQRAAVTDLSYGTLRFGFRLECVLEHLVTKPVHDASLRWLLLVALYQLVYTRAAPHAIVDHAVRCTSRIGHPRAAGLVNAVLRNFLRGRAGLLARAAQTQTGCYAYPQWWTDKLKEQYPAEFAAALEAGNLHPPFTLRVNVRRTSRADYLELLARHDIAARPCGDSAVIFERALPVKQVPGFNEGWVSVQDAAAQLAAPLLDARAGMRVLDACAAPGGKTSHLLELADLQLTAIDLDASRLARVQQNLTRLHLDARLVTGDACDPTAWWDGQPYDRILADVPCSATGVVKRHPDIKWLRRASDVAQFAAQQRRLLDTLWRLLSSGGKLLYTTCSVLQEENSLQIADFLARHADARQLPLCGVTTLDGIPEGQLLPDSEHDGFYFALLQKS